MHWPSYAVTAKLVVTSQWNITLAWMHELCVCDCLWFNFVTHFCTPFFLKPFNMYRRCKGDEEDLVLSEKQNYNSYTNPYLLSDIPAPVHWLWCVHPHPPICKKHIKFNLDNRMLEIEKMHKSKEVCINCTPLQAYCLIMSRYQRVWSQLQLPFQGWT